MSSIEPPNVAGSHLLLMKIWREKCGPALQMNELIGIGGYIVGPLIVKPFLNPDDVPSFNTGNISSNSTAFDNFWNDSTQTTSASPLGGSVVIDDSPEYQRSRSKVAYAFVIVDLTSLAVGFIIVCFFVVDVIRNCRSRVEKNRLSKSQNNQPSPSVDWDSSIRCSDASTSFENNTSNLTTVTGAVVDGSEVGTAKGKCEISNSASTPETQDLFGHRKAMTVTALYFIFTFFFSEIEIGYDGLLMTFSVKFLGWTKHDGPNVTALFQCAAVVTTGAGVLLSRWVKPQVG